MKVTLGFVKHADTLPRFFQGDHAERLFQGDHGDLFRRLIDWFQSNEFTSTLPVDLWLLGGEAIGVEGLCLFPLTNKRNVDPLLSIQVGSIDDGDRLWSNYQKIAYSGDNTDFYMGTDGEHDIDQSGLFDTLTKKILTTLHRRF